MRGNRRRLLSIIGTVMVVIMLSSLLPSVALASSGEKELGYIDIGDPGSEAGHRLRGWGPIEGVDNRGGYGGVGNCRVTWESGDPDKKWCRSASFIMNVPRGYRATKLELRVLDGLADDSFVVYVGCRKVYSYTGLQTGSEDWITHTIDLNRRCYCYRHVRVVIVATGPAWSGFDTYGQLAVDEVTLLGEKCQWRWHRR